MSAAEKTAFEFVCLAECVELIVRFGDSIDREVRLGRGDTIWLSAKQAELRKDLIAAGLLRQLVGMEHINTA